VDEFKNLHEKYGGARKLDSATSSSFRGSIDDPSGEVSAAGGAEFIDPKRREAAESEAARSIKSKYFVSNLFVEKIFDSVTHNYQERFLQLQKEVNVH